MTKPATRPVLYFRTRYAIGAAGASGAGADSGIGAGVASGAGVGAGAAGFISSDMVCNDDG